MRIRLQQNQVDLRFRIITVPGVQEEARRNGVETEMNKDVFSSCDHRMFMMTYVEPYGLTYVEPYGLLRCWN